MAKLKMNHEMSPDERLRFMRGARLAAGVFRSAEALGMVQGGAPCELDTRYHPGVPQVRLLGPALSAIGEDAAMLAGFDAVMTDFIHQTVNNGIPGLEFYDLLTFDDFVKEDADQVWNKDARFMEVVGLAGGAANG